MRINFTKIWLGIIGRKKDLKKEGNDKDLFVDKEGKKKERKKNRF